MAITISGDTPNFSAATITTLTSTTLSDGTNSTSTTNAIQGSAKAWVNFNGVTTATTRASYNVSSVTRNAAGDYTLNFTTALTDANYVAIQAGGSSNTGNMAIPAATSVSSTSLLLQSTTQYRFYMSQTTSGTSNADCGVLMVAIFR